MASHIEFAGDQEQASLVAQPIDEQEIVDESELSDRSDQEPSSGRSKMFRGPALVAVVLVMAMVGAAVAFWPAQGNAAQAGPKQPERLLASSDLYETIVKHSLKFHGDAGDDHIRGLTAEERETLHDQLLHIAREQMEHLATKVEAADSEAGRQLRDLQMQPQEWETTHKVLASLHDKRVRELGEEMMQAVQEAGDDKAAARSLVNERLMRHGSELRELRDELIPKNLHGVPDGPGGLRNWEVAVGAHGIEASADVKDWHASFRADMPVEEEEADIDVETSSQVESDVHQRRLFMDGFVHAVTGTMGMIGAVILSLITTVMSMLSGKGMAKIFWIVQGVLDGVVCGTTLGAMTPWVNWVPCMVMSLFFGLEAIWTWMK